ncbi:MAG: ABC transporter permease [Chloroflexota bacterium]|nr:ABC transporter permease [Chloroflexota bacterium]
MKRGRTWLETLLSLVIVIALWELVARLIGARFPVVPPPSSIGAAGVQASYVIWLNLRLTLIEAAMGLAAGTVFGLLLAAVFAAWPRTEATLYNLVVTIHSIPLVAIAPVLLIWFGVGITAPALVAALACFFPMVVSATRGFRAASPSSLDLMRVLGASATQSFLRVRLPSSMPFIIAALKIAAPASVLGATVGEWLGTAGIGYLLFSSMANFQVPLLWATMLIAAGVAAIGYLIFAGIEEFALDWRGSGNTA